MVEGMNKDDILTKEQVNKQIEARSKEAKELLENMDKMERFLEQLERKLSKFPKVGKYIASIPMLISLIRSYVKKEYTDIPLGSMIAIIGSLIYYLSPVDLIPDIIPGVGYLDDATVITSVLVLIKDDVEQYEKWQKKIIKEFWRSKMSKNREKKRSTGGMILDLILVFATGGLWLIWILVRYLRSNS